MSSYAGHRRGETNSMLSVKSTESEAIRSRERHFKHLTWPAYSASVTSLVVFKYREDPEMQRLVQHLWLLVSRLHDHDLIKGHVPVHVHPYPLCPIMGTHCANTAPGPQTQREWGVQLTTRLHFSFDVSIHATNRTRPTVLCWEHFCIFDSGILHTDSIWDGNTRIKNGLCIIIFHVLTWRWKQRPDLWHVVEGQTTTTTTTQTKPSETQWRWQTGDQFHHYPKQIQHELVIKHSDRRIKVMYAT